MASAAPRPPASASRRHDRRPAARARVGAGDERADRDAGQPAGRRQQQRLDQELRADVPAGGAQRPAQPDLRAALEDRDDHRVGDADAADEQRHRAEAQEQAGQRVVGLGARGERVRRPADVDLLGVLGVGRRREQVVDARDDRRVGAQVHGARRSLGAELAHRRVVADQGRAVELGGELDRRHDPDHRPPAPGDVDQRARTVDAQLLRGGRAQDDRARAAGRGVEEAPAEHRPAEGLQQAGVGRVDRDAAGLLGVDAVAAAHGGVQRAHRIDAPHAAQAPQAPAPRSRAASRRRRRASVPAPRSAGSSPGGRAGAAVPAREDSESPSTATMLAMPMAIPRAESTARRRRVRRPTAPRRSRSAGSSREVMARPPVRRAARSAAAAPPRARGRA